MSPEFNEPANVTDLDAIAERVLVATVQGQSFNVLVRFWKPMPRPKGEWICLYKFIGIGDERFQYAAGIDGVQALQLAMFAVGTELSVLQRDVKLALLGESDLGFPGNLREASGSCPYCSSGDEA
jgi:hypothetical protein